MNPLRQRGRRSSGREERRAPAVGKRALRAGRYLLYLLIITLLLLEAVARIFFRSETNTGELQKQVDRTLVAAFTRPSHHPELLFELTPGADVKWAGTRVLIDEHGTCRTAPGQSPGDAGSLRVALLGDSTSFGWRVEYARTYGEILRRRLEEHWGRSVELRNFSVPGYNSQHHRVCFRERVLPWQPHLVILHYDHNDADPIDAKPPGYMPPEYGDNALGSALLKLLRRRIRAARATRLVTQAQDGPGSEERTFHHYRCSGSRYEQHLAHLKELAAMAQLHEIPVLAYIFNTWLTAQEDPSRDPFRFLLHEPAVSALESYGYYVLDSYQPFRELMARNGWHDLSELWVTPRDAHPGPAGHALIAEMIFAYITSNEQLMRRLEASSAPVAVRRTRSPE